MSDFKSKLPDLEELGSMAGKLYNGIKNSVTEIISDYKEKRAQMEQEENKEEAKAQKSEPKPQSKTEKAEDKSPQPEAKKEQTENKSSKESINKENE